MESSLGDKLRSFFFDLDVVLEDIVILSCGIKFGPKIACIINPENGSKYPTLANMEEEKNQADKLLKLHILAIMHVPIHAPI